MFPHDAQSRISKLVGCSAHCPAQNLLKFPFSLCRCPFQTPYYPLLLTPAFPSQAVLLLEEMEAAGLEPYPPAHQAALTALAASEGHRAAMDLLVKMRVGSITPLPPPQDWLK